MGKFVRVGSLLIIFVENEDPSLNELLAIVAIFDHVPSWELTYPPFKALLKIFLFPRWDMFVPWRDFFAHVDEFNGNIAL